MKINVNLWGEGRVEVVRETERQCKTHGPAVMINLVKLVINKERW